MALSFLEFSPVPEAELKTKYKPCVTCSKQKGVCPSSRQGYLASRSGPELPE